MATKLKRKNEEQDWSIKSGMKQGKIITTKVQMSWIYQMNRGIHSQNDDNS